MFRIDCERSYGDEQSTRREIAFASLTPQSGTWEGGARKRKAKMAALQSRKRAVNL